MLPLKGVRILDLTTLNGFASMELADYGAELIKVERLDGGDPTRAYPPFKDGVAVYHAFMDRGEKSITLNLWSKEGQEVFKKLVKHVDVVIENFKVGTMEKLGVGYDVLSKINPKLVYGALTGFGSTGPLKDYICYDIVSQARSGCMDITGFPDNQPMRVGAFIGDHYSATYLCCAVTMAVYNAKATGVGQRVESSMFEALFSATEDRVMMVDKATEGWSRTGNAHPSINPYDIFKCKDGYIALGVSTDDQWQKFCDVFGKPEWAVDPKYVINAKRGENYFGDLRDKIEDLLSNYGKYEIAAKCDSVKVPGCAVETVKDAINQEQLKVRDMIIKVTDQRIGDIDMPGRIIKFHDETADPAIASAPLLGQDNDVIYGGIFSVDKIAELKAAGVI